MRRAQLASALVFSALTTLGCANQLDPLELEAARASGARPVLDDTPLGEVLAVDISHWSGPITDAEVDCWWDAGYRHLISGTQRDWLARQQMEMAISRGMTVDLYHYVYWDRDPVEQIAYALAVGEGLPVGRLWIDLEEDPGRRTPAELEDYVDALVAACGDHPCGIYTGAGFWRTYMADSDRYRDLPLWHAWWDNNPTLATWETQRFGGWDWPEAKQFEGDIYFCDLITDQNVMNVSAAPTVVVDERYPAGDASRVPPAPTGLWPDDQLRLPSNQIRPMSRVVPGADRYEIHLESWSGSRWSNYFTFARDEAAVRVSPVFHNRAYRFRVRAHNAAGWGPWSTWATFAQVDNDSVDVFFPNAADPSGPTTNPPDSSEPVDPAPEPELEPEPVPVDVDAPTNLSPAGESIATSSVTLACDPFAGASGYEFAIENEGSNGFRPYFTYATSAPEKTFWPATRGVDYRFRVRADGGEWSAWSQFHVE